MQFNAAHMDKRNGRYVLPSRSGAFAFVDIDAENDGMIFHETVEAYTARYLMYLFSRFGFDFESFANMRPIHALEGEAPR